MSRRPPARTHPIAGRSPDVPGPTPSLGPPLAPAHAFRPPDPGALTWPALLGSPARSLHPPWPAGHCAPDCGRRLPDNRADATGRGRGSRGLWARAGGGAAAGDPGALRHASRTSSLPEGWSQSSPLPRAPPPCWRDTAPPGTACISTPPRQCPASARPAPGHHVPRCPLQAAPGDNGSPASPPAVCSSPPPPPSPGGGCHGLPRFTEVYTEAGDTTD